MSTTDPAKELAHALGRIPSGLFVVTAGADTALLASWVQQCSFEPPLISVAVRRGRPIADLLPVGAAFTVNVLGEGQKQLLAHFGKGFEPGEPAFDGLAVEPSAEGPVVLSEAHAHLVCRVEGCLLTGGDHDLVIGRVVAGRAHTDGRPMVHVRRSGLHY